MPGNRVVFMRKHRPHCGSFGLRACKTGKLKHALPLFDYHWDRPLWGWRGRSFHCYITALTVAEGHTQYYFMHQGARAVVILAEGLRQLRNRAAISILQAASQGVSEHFAAQLAQEVVFLIH